jgi:amidase
MRGIALGALVLAGCAEGDDPRPRADVGMKRAQLVEAPDAAALPEALRTGETSVVDTVSAYLRRIELLDDTGPTLQAVLTVNPDAVSRAEQLQAKRREGEEPGLLYGLPILVKDNIETRDMPTTAGSLALKDNDTGRDAPAIARLREADAIILGKTNLSEWANFRSSQSISGWSGLGGQTRNPHDLSRNACGSSSGSGAAVAAGLAWAALGTETNGSVTCPAAVNGIVGFKPTVGLVSRRLVVPISPSQDTIGPMTTNVRDAALLLTALAGTDPDDEATAEADDYAIDFTDGLDTASLEGVRLGVLRFAEAEDPREKAVWDEALRRAEAAGAVLVDIEEWGGPQLGGAAYDLLKAEFKDSLDAYLADAAPDVEVRSLEELIAFNRQNDRELSLFGQNILEESQAMEGMRGEAYEEAVRTAQEGTRREGMDRLLVENDVDFLIAPSFGPAWVIDEIRGDVIASNAGAGWIAAIAGYPHLTVPMGDFKGLPLGLSIMGPRWSDGEVLAVGQAFETILPPRVEPSFRANAAADGVIAASLKPSR